MSAGCKRPDKPEGAEASPPSKRVRGTSKSPSRAEKEKKEAEAFLGKEFNAESRRSAAQHADDNRKRVLEILGVTPQKESNLKATKSPKKASTTKRAKSPKKSSGPLTRSTSPIRIAVKPKRSGLKRMSTMEETASEAMAFLECLGSKTLLESSGTLPETRGRTQARNVLEEMMSEEPVEVIEAEFDEEEERSKLHTIFQLIDFDGAHVIGEEEMAELMRSMGKRPLKKKVRQIIADIKPKEKGKVSEKEFVDFMVQKRSVRFTKKKEKKVETSANKQSPTRSRSPKKASTSPRKASASPKKSSSPNKKGGSPKRGNNLRAAAPIAALSPVPSPAAPSTALAPMVARNDILKFYSTTKHTKLYGLGRDHAFCDFTVLVYVGAHSDILSSWIRLLLVPKRFQVIIESDLAKFVAGLPNACEAWIFSGSDGSGDTSAKGPKQPVQDWSSISQKDFISAVKSFHETGRGIALFASGEPYLAEANAILSSFEIQLGGSTKAGGVELSVKANPVMSGVTSLYEGRSISYPSMDNTEGFKVLATSSEGHPTIFVKDMSKKFPPTGRIVVDTGYSKLLHLANENVFRYFSNVAVWLLSLDYRIRKNAALRGTLIPENIQYVWQYLHGGWYNYDEVASKFVEEKFVEYLDNPGKNDVRSVHSGHWNYLVDFLNMKQTNIQHSDHTQRDIRRVPKTQSIS